MVPSCRPSCSWSYPALGRRRDTRLRLRRALAAQPGAASSPLGTTAPCVIPSPPPLSNAFKLFFSTHRPNLLHQGVNLILAERTLEGRHSALAVGNDFRKFRIGQLLDFRRSTVRNVHAITDLRATSILSVARGAFRPERRTARRAVRAGVCLHNRDNKKREADKKQQQNCRGEDHMALNLVLCHGFFPLLVIFPSSSGHFPTQRRRDRQLRPSLVIGRSLTRLPDAAKMALQNAATNGGTPGSPTPAGGASLSIMYTFV